MTCARRRRRSRVVVVSVLVSFSSCPCSCPVKSLVFLGAVSRRQDYTHAPYATRHTHPLAHLLLPGQPHIACTPLRRLAMPHPYSTCPHDLSDAPVRSEVASALPCGRTWSASTCRSAGQGWAAAGAARRRRRRRGARRLHARPGRRAPRAAKCRSRPPRPRSPHPFPSPATPRRPADPSRSPRHHTSVIRLEQKRERGASSGEFCRASATPQAALGTLCTFSRREARHERSDSRA